MKRDERARVGLGIPSLVLILLVLCLALLGVLALLSARADRQMALRYAELTLGYAEASGNMEKTLSALDLAMTDARLTSEDETQFAAACCEIETIADIAITWIDDTHAVMAFDAGVDRELRVEIKRCEWANALEKRFELVKCALEDGKDWEQTESLNLMDI